MFLRDSSSASVSNNMSRTRQGSNATLLPNDKRLREQEMNAFGKRFSAVTYLGFIVLQFFLYVCSADAGEILIAPRTQYALLNVNERATFFCQASGVNVYWLINGDTVFADGDAMRISQGWTFSEVIDHDVQTQTENVHNLTVEIPAVMQFNNTKVQCAGVIHDPAVSDPVYLILKRTIYLFLESESTIASSIHYTTTNENMKFYCGAVGFLAFWGINSSTVDDDGDSDLINMGYTFNKNVVHDLMGTDHVYKNSLIVPARIDHNNTEIKCIITTGSDQRSVESDAIKIIVMGAPSVPDPSLIFDRPGSVTLEWNRPFSWSDYPVQNYNIRVTDRPGEIVRGDNETSIHFERQDGEECEEIEFKVRASNALGDSEYGSVLAGFPIAPELRDQENTIEATESKQQNNKPQLSIKVQLPRVCSFQSTSYTIIVEGAEPKQPIVRGPFNGTVSSDTVEVTEGIEWGKAYLVRVEFILDVNAQALSAFKDVYIQPAVVTPNVGGISTPDGSSQQYIIIGVVGAGIVLIALVVMVIAIAIMVHIRKRKSMRSWSPSNPTGKRPMVTNPIYDAGPVYETIPPNTPFRQHSASECSTMTTISCSIPPTPSSPLPPIPLPVESPYAYAPNQVDPAYALPHRQNQTQFNFDDASYMIMNAVRDSDLKRISTDEETNLDCHSDVSSSRYVPEPCASMV